MNDAAVTYQAFSALSLVVVLMTASFGCYLHERGIQPFRKLFRLFRRPPDEVAVALLFTLGMVYYAATKPARSPKQPQSLPRPEITAPLPTRPVTSDAPLFPAWTNAVESLCISGIQPAETSVFLRAHWPGDITPAPTGIEVYAAPSLETNTWAGVGTAPILASDTSVIIELSHSLLPEACQNSVFFQLGFNTDSDQDGLSDTFERIVTLTDASLADTDGDGMPDGWEHRHGFDPLSPSATDDADCDGLANADEFRLGTDPNAPDTDGDSITDGLETGSVTELRGADFLWLDTSGLTNLLDAADAIDDFQAGIPLSCSVNVNGLCYTNAVIDLDGLVTLIHPGRQAAVVGSGFPRIEGMGDRLWSADHVTIAAYNTDVYAKTDENGWGSAFTYGTVTTNGKEYSVIEYRDVGHHSLARATPPELMSFQVILPADETNVVYVSYLNVDDAIPALDRPQNFGVQLPGTNRVPERGVYANVTWNKYDGCFAQPLTLKYVLGTGSDPNAADRDGDGLDDYEEVFVRRTDPYKPDTDDDGIGDRDEIAAGLAPDNPDTDGDGMPDGWEVENRLDPILPDADTDPDGDGLACVWELYNGTNPHLADTDGDGLSDGAEGDWYDDTTDDVPWFDIEPVKTFSPSTSQSSQIIFCDLPFAVRLSGQNLRIAAADVNGVVYFAEAAVTNSIRSQSSARDLSEPRTNGFVTVAGYWSNLSMRPSLNSSISFGIGTAGTNRHFVIQYNRVGFSSGRTNEVSFQVSVAESEPRVVHVRYGNVKDVRSGAPRVSLGCQGAKESGLEEKPRMNYYCQTRPPAIPPGLTVSYHFGTGGSPLNRDTDDDGLEDGEEERLGTNPRRADTDGDGFTDIEETMYGMNPCSRIGRDGADGDLDGDMLPNIKEMDFGTDILMPDTDGDSLTDGMETGAIFATNVLPWLSFASYEDITAQLSSAGRYCVTRPLPVPLKVQGEIVSNVTISAKGLVFLNRAGYANPGNTISDFPFTGILNENALILAPYLQDASIRTDIAGRESSVRYGTATYSGESYVLIEWNNIFGNSKQLIEISFQLTIPIQNPDRAYARYRDIGGSMMDGRKAGIGMQTFGGRWLHSWCYRDRGRVENGLALMFLFGENTDPLCGDTDGDGLPDAIEVAIGTSPVKSDTDGDGMSDGWEVLHGFNPLDAGFHDEDYDNDGLSNLDESRYGSDPHSADTDGDGLEDGFEVGIGTAPAMADTDNDGLDDCFEYYYGLNPCNPDTDKDGLPDGWEVEHDLDPDSAPRNNEAGEDPDFDGLSNLEEYQNGCNPRNFDTDGDGVSDGVEVRQGSDPTDPSDCGAAPPEERFRYIEFKIGGDYAAWEMTIEGLGPDDMRTRKIAMGAPNAQRDALLKLRKGNSYLLSMHWKNGVRHGDEGFWYCWQAQIDSKPDSGSYNSYSSARLPGNEFLVGDGWFAENCDGLLTSHVHMCDPESSRGGNVAGKLYATLYVLDDPKLTPDYNRDGRIDEEDTAAGDAGTAFRFWINDDADDDATDGKYAESPGVDIPGARSGFWEIDGRDPDWDDNEVNGWRDLIDFTPVYMDLSCIRDLPSDVRNKLSFRLRHNAEAVNVVWSDLDKYSVGRFQKEEIAMCGRYLAEYSYGARTETVDADGVEIPKELLRKISSGSSSKGVMFIEGRRAASSPLLLDVYYGDEKIATGGLDLKLSPVEDMYWFYSLHGAESVEYFSLPGQYTPGNLLDAPHDRDVFFTHGFNVSAEDARAWGSEIFKRLWQSGSDARFHMVAWPGNYHWTGNWANGLHYQRDVFQALKSANAFKRLIEREQAEPSKRVVMAQSLGNMMACEAFRQGLTADQYFMFDAAVASEAIDERYHDNSPETRAKYVPSDWSDYHPGSWASNWYEWFKDDPADSRGKMGWPGYFKDALANVSNVYNYYSSGDPVFMEDTSVPGVMDGIFHWPTLQLTWPFIDWNITAEVYCWQKQETHKGVEPIAGTLKGGWGFYSWTERVGREDRIVYYSAATANVMVATGTITNTPVFSIPGTQMDNRNASQDDIWFALAEYVPAISSPVGGNTITFSNIENFNLNDTSYRNGWGRMHTKFYDYWLHSDMKDMSYFYVYPLFNEIITRGNLK